MKKMLSFVLLSLVLNFAATAHEHDLAMIKGKGITLFEKNHAFSGLIHEVPVFGEFSHEPFGAKVLIRNSEKTLELNLVSDAQRYLGEMAEVRGSGEAARTIKTTVELVKIQRLEGAKGVITLSLDGEEVAVNVEAPKFENNHFFGPTFKATIKGEEVRFTFTGEACFGYSSNLAMMILASHTHLQKQ